MNRPPLLAGTMTVLVTSGATLFGLAPASAAGEVLGATASYSAPLISVIAQPGLNNDISVNWRNVPGEPSLQVEDADTGASQVIRLDASCGGTAGDYVFNTSCGAGGDDPTVLIALGDGNDTGMSYNSNAFGHRASIFGGEGDDTLLGSASTDYLYGGPGNDDLTPDGGVLDVNGGDVVSGGPGVDTLRVHSFPTDAMVITLDGVADDGETGENDNYGADIENVLGAQRGRNVIVANGAVNSIVGGDFNDSINVRDGVADTVDCGGIGDTDTVVADRIDILTNCEQVLYPPVGAGSPSGANPTGVALASTKLKVDRRRNTATAKIRCPKGGPTCRGKIKVKAGKVKVASAAYTAKAGKTDKVTLKLSTKARRLLAKKKKAAVVISLKPKGGDSITLSGTLKR